MKEITMKAIATMTIALALVWIAAHSVQQQAEAEDCFLPLDCGLFDCQVQVQGHPLMVACRLNPGAIPYAVTANMCNNPNPGQVVVKAGTGLNCGVAYNNVKPGSAPIVYETVCTNFLGVCGLPAAQNCTP